MTHTATTTTTTTASHDGDEDPAPTFASPDGLRTLLERLHHAGPGAWRGDPEAAELMRYATDRYAALARKHHCEPADAAVAAFEAMLNTSTRTAADPWAVVTTAVRVTLIADERANDLLTSTDRARRPEYSSHHDVTRFSDHEHDLAEYHSALHAPEATSELETHDSDAGVATGPDLHERVIGDTVALLATLGWPAEEARLAVAYVCARLVETGDRYGAYEALRRDKAIRAQLDWPHESWIGLLRIVLGHPAAPDAPARHGVLARMLIGDDVAVLLGDDDVVLAIDHANPHTTRQTTTGGGRDE